MDVARVLSDRFNCMRCHAEREWFRISRPARRENSTIHRFQCIQCGDQIVAKVFRGGVSRYGDGDAKARARREYETLLALQRLFAPDGRYGTLEPLGCLESVGSGIVITHLFPGDDLIHYMKRLDAVGVAETCRAAGEWLRTLHESSESDPQTRELDTADKLSYLTDNYGALLRGNRKMWTAYRRLEKEGPRSGLRAFRTARLHGDFKPENMLCDGTRYVGLDVQWRTVGPAVYDLAPFLNHLWLAGRSIGSPKNRHYDLAETAFLAGYGDADEMRGLRWAQLYFALCQMGGYLKRGHLVGSYGDWKMRPLVGRLTAQLERTA